MDTTLPTVTIYTDGACHGNPGPGGWASILVCGKNEKELCGGEPETTNNRMELLAVISGLEALKRPSCVKVISDSTYVVNAFEKNWIETWQRKNWVRGGKPIPNSDLWIRLLQAREPHSVTFQWIRGHAGHPYNERCDRLAVRESLRFPPRSEKQKKGLPRIYADNAATTSVSPAVLSAMLPYFTESFSNPSSLYRTARDAKAALSEARKTIASSIGAEANEIFFTSGGTEGDNWVVKSIALSYRKTHPSGGHILVSAIEHHAVLRAAYAMSDLGFAVSEVLPDRFGILHPEDFAEQIREDTVLVALMLANNEIGTIQPVRETSEAAHSFGIPVLCDAVAACGQLPLDVSKIGADYLVVSGHKIHGPKGIGFLYAKSGAPLSPLLDGGGQESGMRAGTENVAFAVGLAKALEGAALPQETDRLRALQTRLFDGLLSIEGTSVNGSMNPAFRLPGNVNISIPDLSAESILLLLDAAGISASAGSACNSESTEPSHVLLAIGRERDAASSSLRFTLSPDQTEEEIDTIIRETARIVRLLRTAQ